MTTGAAGPTPPEPSQPLTEREKAALARLEADTRREDPEWFDLLGAQSPRQRRLSPRVRDLTIQVVVVVVLAVVLMPSAWLGGLVAVMVLIGPLGVALWAMRRGLL
jgi:Flp pilus assembly protein TadB